MSLPRLLGLITCPDREEDSDMLSSPIEVLSECAGVATAHENVR